MRFTSGLVAISIVAAAVTAHAAPLLLRDGPHTRELLRLDTPRPPHAPPGARTAVRWSDAASGRAAPAFIGARAIVQVAAGTDLPALGVRPLRALMPAAGLWLVESAARDEDGLALADRLQHHPAFGHAVTQALPDLYLARQHDSLQLPVNDPQYPGQWFFQQLKMEDAWRLESGRATVTVVVIDSGCDATHPDLRDQLDPGRDVIDGDDDPSPVANAKGNAHGTACAGLVAASTGNHLGVAGTCPGCRLRCVRFLDDSGSGLVPISADVDAFQFVLDSGAAVASNSWGFTDPAPVPQPLSDAIQMVYDHGRGGLGTLVVFAAGNDNRLLGDDELNAVRGVTTVGVVNNFGELTQFSNFGPSVDVVSPLGTLTTDISGPDGDDPGDYTSTFGGTSSACPIVAGLYGLMVSAAPKRTAPEIEAALRMTAQQSLFAKPNAAGHDDFYGYGVIQPAAALRAIAPPPPKSSGGCQLAPTPTPPWPLALLVLLVRRRRTA